MDLGRNLLLVGFGGFIGSIARYGVGLIFAKYFSQNFPYGTFTINLVGCLLMGFFYGIFQKESAPDTSWNLFLMVGICGGFTTFSSFSLESFELLRNSNYNEFFLYTIGSFVLGILAIWVGLTLTKLI